MNATPELFVAGFSHAFPIVVQWGEMDPFGHVNNAVYFRYFETARIAYFGEMGVLDTLGRTDGVGPVLASTSCRFLLPLSHPDTIDVGVKITEVGEYSIQMEYAIFSRKLGKLAATADALVVPFDFAAKRKVLIPASWREAMSRLGA